MGLFEDLRNLSEQIKKRQAHVKGEEATKQALVLPLLQVLGFDIYDPTEVKPEYIADFAKKKSSGQFEKIDYAIYIKNEPAIFVECKAIDVAVEDHDGQLARYFNSTPSVKLAVITNGLQYRFFTDLRATNIMDPTPFLEFSTLRVTEREAELIKPFTKDNFNSAIIQRHAEEVISLEKVTVLVNELLRNPSENFIRFILSELELVGGRVTANVVTRFEPIIKKSIQTALLGMMTKSIQQEISPESLPPPTPVVAQEPSPSRILSDKALPTVEPVTKAPSQAAKPGSSALLDADGITAPGAETTEEEKEIFLAVKGICEQSPIKQPVKYKDSINFLAINLGPVRSWFLRLVTNGRRKFLLTRLPVSLASRLAAGFQVEEVAEAVIKSRVYFSTTADIGKLRALILHAYEEAARKLQAGSSDTDDGAD